MGLNKTSKWLLAAVTCVVLVIVLFVCIAPQGSFKDIVQFLDDHTGALSFIATLVLVIVTARYVFLSRDMARTMKRDLEIRIKPRPHITYIGPFVSGRGSMVRVVEVKVQNCGHYPFWVEKVRLEAWPVGREDLKSTPLEYKVTRYLSPAQEPVSITPLARFEFSDSSESAMKLDKDQRAEGRIHVYYSGIESDERHDYSCPLIASTMEIQKNSDDSN